jgi:phosphate-selective porin OprO and OprP
MRSFLVLVLLSVPALAQPAESPVSPDKPKLDLKPGGYVQLDSRRQLNDTEAHDMTIRRLRFKLDGGATRYFKFRTLIDFAGSKLVVDDAWAELAIAPELALRVGKDKSQFSLERLQSAANLVFLERAFPTQISPNRDIGAWLRGDLQNGLVHYAFGVVDGVADNAVLEGESDDVVELNAHVLVSPFARRKELGDLAIGGATTFGRTHGTLAAPGLTNIKTDGQATVVKYATGDTLDTTARADGYRTRFTAHGYYYGGPVGVLAEYVRDREPVLLMGAHQLLESSAWQLASSVAVTPGDHPAYKGLKPVRPFDLDKRGYGAVELAGRYTELRIDPDGAAIKMTSGVERAREFELGGNWYFNDYLKLQLDYSLTTFDGDRTSEHLIATRLQTAI